MNDQKKQVVLQCRASQKLGVGHVMRCMTLADALIEKGFQCLFLTNTETVETVPELERFDLHQENHIYDHVDYFVIDDYELGTEYERVAKQYADKIIVIDDLIDRPYRCHLIVNQNYGVSEDDYNGKINADCRVLAGVKYAMLRSEFKKKRQDIGDNFRSNIKNILVMTGGTNVKTSTQKNLRALENFVHARFNIHVVMGQNAKGIDEVEVMVTQMETHAITLHIQPDNMVSLMAQADVAIGACGSTTWERACLGLPQMLIGLADNQIPTLEKLAKDKIIHSLGNIDDFGESVLHESLKSWIDNPKLIHDFSQKGMRLCDGEGVSRVVQAIEEL